jgi:hypothetical protein
MAIDTARLACRSYDTAGSAAESGLREQLLRAYAKHERPPFASSHSSFGCHLRRGGFGAVKDASPFETAFGLLRRRARAASGGAQHP